MDRPVLTESPVSRTSTPTLDAEARRGGVSLWALLGVFWILFVGQAWGRWVLSDTQFGPAPIQGPDTFDGTALMVLRVIEVVSLLIDLEETPIDIGDLDVLAADLAAPEAEDTDTDFIYQKMLSEFLVDPKTVAVPQDWKSVWDNGWATAADVDNVPVRAHTEHGLPVREPGARLVPGAAEPNAMAANGIQPAAQPPAPELPRRDPEAVRASFSSHFGGVRAARANTQSGPTENGRDQQ